MRLFKVKKKMEIESLLCILPRKYEKIDWKYIASIDDHLQIEFLSMQNTMKPFLGSTQYAFISLRSYVDCNGKHIYRTEGVERKY